MKTVRLIAFTRHSIHTYFVMSWARESNHKYIGEAFAALYMKGIFTSYAVRDYNFLSTVADLDAHQRLILKS